MPAFVTEAIVLHMSDYLESSRILRLATRESGVLSVVARGARNSRKRFGSAIDLFALGQAQIDAKPNRDLHTLLSFDVQDAHGGVAGSLRRFSTASAFAEVILRVVHDETAPLLFEHVIAALREMSDSPGENVEAVGLGAFWRLVRDVGFAPQLHNCALCQSALPPDESVYFHHASGGALCHLCRRRAVGGRHIPAQARAAIDAWLDGRPTELNKHDRRAHQRLLREFLSQHLLDGRPLRAYLAWEGGALV